MTNPAPAPEDIPIFSPRLDEVLGMMINGEAPNLGRFCGYCYTPMSKSASACPHCARSTSDVEPLPKLPSEIIGLYRRWRKRESLVVNSFAFAGLFLGVVIFTILVAVAVYRMDASLWMLGFATIVLLVGGRVFAGLLGGWIGDDIGYRYARRKLVEEWAEYEQSKSTDTSTPAAAPAPGAS
jgi:hypothetical protein